MVDGQVRVAGVELALHAKDARLHEDRDLVGQQRLTASAQVVVLPEGGNVTHALLVLLRHVEHVAIALLELVELVDDEAQGVLGEDRSVAVLGRLVARDERLVLDVDRHVIEHVGEGQCTAHDGRLVLGAAVGLRVEHGALCVHEGLLVEHLLAVGLHALGQGAKVLSVLHDSSLFHVRMLYCFRS